MATKWSSHIVYSLSLKKNIGGAWRNQTKREKNNCGKKLKRLVTKSYRRRNENSLENNWVTKNCDTKKQYNK